MKKRTVAALALSISSPSYALMLAPVKTKTICLDVYESETGVKYSGNCDQSANNAELNLEILENGCAEGQIALTSVAYPDYSAPKKKAKKEAEPKFDIEIKACLAPNIAQL